MPHLPRRKWHNYILSWVYKLQTNSEGQWIRKVACPGYLFQSFGAQWRGGQDRAHKVHERSCFHWSSWVLPTCSSSSLSIFLNILLSYHHLMQTCHSEESIPGMWPTSHTRYKIHLEKGYPRYSSNTERYPLKEKSLNLVDPNNSNSLMRSFHLIISTPLPCLTRMYWLIQRARGEMTWTKHQSLSFY